MCRLLSATVLTSFLVGCGGGGTPAHTSGNPVTNQAVLGPLSGATANAYRLTDLATAIEGPTKTAASATDLTSAGMFALELDGIADSEWILVAVSGGEDIDADDDGVYDATATLNNGTLYAVAKASTWKAGEGKITALSDIAWRYAQDQASDIAALETRLEAIADWLIASDIDGDSTVDYDDLVRFNPRQASTQSAINYSTLLPSGDFANPSHIDRLHSGDSEEVIATALDENYGTMPWTIYRGAHSFLDAGGALGSLGMPMVYLNAQGQSFTQGCHSSALGETGVNDDPNCQTEEKPERTVTFANSFAMSAHEVTWDAWDACVADGGCSGGRDDGYGKGTRPVTNVSYDDITTEFIPWLNSKTGQSFRLPTESEWEYAARAGSTTVYSWGDTASHEYANYGTDSCCSGLASGSDLWVNTAPAGSFPANAYGLYDLHGNVTEWTADLYDGDYRVLTSRSDRDTGDNTPNRFARGGSWFFDSDLLRSARRVWGIQSYRLNYVGFRLVQDLSL